MHVKSSFRTKLIPFLILITGTFALISYQNCGQVEFKRNKNGKSDGGNGAQGNPPQSLIVDVFGNPGDRVFNGGNTCYNTDQTARNIDFHMQVTRPGDNTPGAFFCKRVTPLGDPDFQNCANFDPLHPDNTLNVNPNDGNFVPFHSGGDSSEYVYPDTSNLTAGHILSQNLVDETYTIQIFATKNSDGSGWNTDIVEINFTICDCSDIQCQTGGSTTTTLINTTSTTTTTLINTTSTTTTTLINTTSTTTTTLINTTSTTTTTLIDISSLAVRFKQLDEDLDPNNLARIFLEYPEESQNTNGGEVGTPMGPYEIELIDEAGNLVLAPEDLLVKFDILYDGIDEEFRAGFGEEADPADGITDFFESPIDTTTVNITSLFQQGLNALGVTSPIHNFEVTILQGESSALVIGLRTKVDTVYENHERYKIFFNPGTDSRLAIESPRIIEVEIKDNDPQVTTTTTVTTTSSTTTTTNFPIPEVTIEPANISQVEGDSGDTAINLLVKLSNPAPQGEVARVNVVATNFGGAEFGTDYECLPPPGATINMSHPEGVSILLTFTHASLKTEETIVCNIKGDLIDELDEQFRVFLETVDATATLGSPSSSDITIEDDDTANLEIVVTPGDLDAPESNTERNFVVRSDKIIDRDVTFDIQTANISALAGPDYGGLSASETLPKDTLEKAFAVTVVDDNYDEGIEQFSIHLSNAKDSGGTPINIATAMQIISIVDNDATPTLSWVEKGYMFSEPGAGILNNEVGMIQLSAPSGRTVSVQVQAYDDTATRGVDYEFPTNPLTVTFTPDPATGITPVEMPIPVGIRGDGVFENSEIYDWELSNAIAANLIPGEERISVTIKDYADDKPSVFLVDQYPNSAPMQEPFGNITADQTFKLHLRLSKDSAVDTVVRIKKVLTLRAENQATWGDDYRLGYSDPGALALSKVTIPAGSKLPNGDPGIEFDLVVHSDSVFEGPERVDLKIESVAGNVADIGSPAQMDYWIDDTAVDKPFVGLNKISGMNVETDGGQLLKFELKDRSGNPVTLKKPLKVRVTLEDIANSSTPPFGDLVYGDPKRDDTPTRPDFYFDNLTEPGEEHLARHIHIVPNKEFEFTIHPGVFEAQFNIVVIDDAYDEFDERKLLRLSVNTDEADLKPAKETPFNRFAYTVKDDNINDGVPVGGFRNSSKIWVAGIDQPSIKEGQSGRIHILAKPGSEKTMLAQIDLSLPRFDTGKKPINDLSDIVELEALRGFVELEKVSSTQYKLKLKPHTVNPNGYAYYTIQLNAIDNNFYSPRTVQLEVSTLDANLLTISSDSKVRPFGKRTVKIEDNGDIPPLSSFSIEGVHRPNLDTVVDDFLQDTNTNPTVRLSNPGSATQYRVRIYPYSGSPNSPLCDKTLPSAATGNIDIPMENCTLQYGVDYRIHATASNPMESRDASNIGYRLEVGQLVRLQLHYSSTHRNRRSIETSTGIYKPGVSMYFNEDLGAFEERPNNDCRMPVKNNPDFVMLQAFVQRKSISACRGTLTLNNDPNGSVPCPAYWVGYIHNSTKVITSSNYLRWVHTPAPEVCYPTNQIYQDLGVKNTFWIEIYEDRPGRPRRTYRREVSFTKNGGTP